MSKVLVVNCGSSSLKCALFSLEEGECIARGAVARIDTPDALLTWDAGGRREEYPVVVSNHSAAFACLVDLLPGSNGDVSAIGHRVVHGGERFDAATPLDADVEDAIAELSPLAPMHNPLCLEGIRAARGSFTEAAQYAVFDTAFHQTLPEAAFRYAVPQDWYEADGVRRYGFHGTSHRFVSRRVAELDPERAGRLIVCHLGAGCSTSAIRDGLSVDTSMGMTPLEGLVMATRSGDLDPGVISYLARRSGLRAEEIETALNERSGLLGLSSESGDIRVLEQRAAEGHPRAELALQVFAHRAKKYIGAHHATLGGATAIAFTGGAGENSPSLRKRIMEGLAGLDMVMDDDANDRARGCEAFISSSSSRIALLVVPTDEERAIADEVREIHPSS